MLNDQYVPFITDPLYDAWKDGQYAWEQCIPRLANPYNYGTDEHKEWDRGWELCECPE